MSSQIAPLPEPNVHDSSQTNGDSKHSTDLTTMPSNQLPTYSNNIDQEGKVESAIQELGYEDTQVGQRSPITEQSTEVSQQVLSINNVIPNLQELNGRSHDNVPLDPEAVTMQTVQNTDNSENSATTETSKIASAEVTHTDEFSHNEIISKTQEENQSSDAEQAAE